jgi:hypothetical protein
LTLCKIEDTIVIILDKNAYKKEVGFMGDKNPKKAPKKKGGEKQSAGSTKKK